MNKKEMEARIERAVSKVTPDDFDAILNEARQMPVNYNPAPEKKRKTGWVRIAACAAAALVLVVTGAFGFRFYNANFAVASTVALEVNPSLEITVNQKETVLEVIPKNDDAKAVIGDMDFRGSKLDITVNALVGSMVRHGYLSEMANSILVSVDSNGETGAALQDKLTREINDIFATDGFSGAVLSQTIREDDSLAALAEEYGITPGKAQLIEEIIQKDSRYTFEALSGLSINDLNLILKSKVGAAEAKTIAAAGTASDARYIGRDAAERAALDAAGVSEAEALDGVYIGMDWEDGVMVYEVEFNAGNWGYECEVNATDGRVLKCERDELHPVTVTGGTEHHDEEHHSDVQPSGGTTPSTGTAQITEDAAYSAAFAHAGVDASTVTAKRIALDRDDGRTVYEIEFQSGGYEYDYEIDAATGSVVKGEKEKLRGTAANENSGAGNTTGNTAGQSGDVGAAEAKRIALEHAGVAESDTTGLWAKLDRDDGISVYDVEFYSGGYEYDYEIDAATGTIRSHSREWEGTAPSGQSAAQPAGDSATPKPSKTVVSNRDDDWDDDHDDWDDDHDDDRDDWDDDDDD